MSFIWIAVLLTFATALHTTGKAAAESASYLEDDDPLCQQKYRE